MTACVASTLSGSTGACYEGDEPRSAVVLGEAGDLPVDEDLESRTVRRVEDGDVIGGAAQLSHGTRMRFIGGLLGALLVVHVDIVLPLAIASAVIAATALASAVLPSVRLLRCCRRYRCWSHAGVQPQPPRPGTGLLPPAGCGGVKSP